MLSIARCLRRSKANHSPGIQDHTILSSEKAFNGNEVDALYILYELLSSSVFDDGLIHKEFCLALFSRSSKQNLLAEKTPQEADLKGDGKIDIEEWKELVAKNPSLIRNVTLPYLREIMLELFCGLT